MKIDEIKELMNEVNRLGLTGLKYTNNGIGINIKNDNKLSNPNTNLVATNNQISEEQVSKEKEKIEVAFGDTINSPIVGVFYKSSSPSSPDFVSVGDIVKKGSVLCIVEAMKVMNEIIADYDMKIISVNVLDGDMVEFNQDMFTIERI